MVPGDAVPQDLISSGQTLGKGEAPKISVSETEGRRKRSQPNGIRQEGKGSLWRVSSLRGRPHPIFALPAPSVPCLFRAWRLSSSCCTSTAWSHTGSLHLCIDAGSEHTHTLQSWARATGCHSPRACPRAEWGAASSTDKKKSPSKAPGEPPKERTLNTVGQGPRDPHWWSQARIGAEGCCWLHSPPPQASGPTTAHSSTGGFSSSRDRVDCGPSPVTSTKTQDTTGRPQTQDTDRSRGA